MGAVKAKRRAPLSAFARARLKDLARAPIPTFEINPGVIQRLLVDGYATIEFLPSPCKKDKGKPRSHLAITPAGRGLIEKKEKGDPYADIH